MALASLERVVALLYFCFCSGTNHGLPASLERGVTKRSPLLMASLAIRYTLTFVQRLFTTIIPGRPGIGLLLLRLALVVGFVGDAMVRVQQPALWQMLAALAEFPLAGLLLIGLWTPIAGVLACSLQLGLIFLGDGQIEPPLLRAVMCLCLSLLGPGHWSIDARLFGRKRVTIKSLHHV